MKRIAEAHTYDQVVQAEIAHEILNTARSIIYTEMRAAKAQNPKRAEDLFQKSKEIHSLQRSFDVVDDAVVAEIIATWGERIKDRERFLRDL